MLHRRWFPDHIEGELVVLRRHTRENLRDFMRWYQDPEVARLTRYQDGPMRTEEIERFFTMRALGPDSMAKGIHVRQTNALIGSCAFSQLDGDNGSALFHITIGDRDAWGHGYGSEATRLMVDHAFGSLGLHRVALSVFAFNERAIRAYLRVGFATEGRSREAICATAGGGTRSHERARTRVARALAGRAAADGRAGTFVDGAASDGLMSETLPRGPRSKAPSPGEKLSDASERPAADAARVAFREQMDAKGHAVVNARLAVEGLEAAFASGALRRTPALDAMLGDLAVALEQDEGQKLGGKSAEAARFILRAISRELDNA
jgi:RimJ/RimL family protein N-acetyltransferase